MSNGDDQTIGEELFAILSEDGVHLDLEDLNDEKLLEIREDIINHVLPEFITPDFQEGWLIYARTQITQYLIRSNRKLRGRTIRAFVPVLDEYQQPMDIGRPWIATDRAPEELAIHAKSRLGRHIRMAFRLPGEALLSTGTYTVDQIRALGHAEVDLACDNLEGAQGAVA